MVALRFGPLGQKGVTHDTHPAPSSGCLGVAVSATGVLSVGFVVPLPGWTYKVESAGGGSNSRVQVEFTHTASGARAMIRVEPGKTLTR